MPALLLLIFFIDVTLATMGVMPSRIVLVQPERTADALFSTEQILKSFGAGVVLFWQTHIQNESLRRLNLAAADTDGCFFLFRPLASAHDASPAPLRVSLTPADGGVDLTFLKRRGSSRDSSLFLPLSLSFIVPGHVPLDRPVPAQLALASLEPHWPSNPDWVSVVLEHEKVLALSGAARGAGIKPAMRRGGVLMLVPDARIHDRSPAAEAEALQAAALAMFQYKPCVTLADESILLMDVGATSKFSQIINT